MIYLVCYDLENNRLRAALAAKLQDWGLERIQKSVFVGTLTEAHQARLTEWLEQAARKNRDRDETFSVLMVNLAPGQVERSKHYGHSGPDWPYILGQVHTLIL